MMKSRIILCIMALLMTVGATEAREIYNLNRNWQFFSNYEGSSDAALTVNLPHIWNYDALGGKRDYFRGVGNYLKDIQIPRVWQGKRVFVRFNGATTISHLNVNGRFVGEHKGGYNAFTFEITDFLKFGDKNKLWVMVNNSPQMSVFPLGGDANVYGGLFRGVELIVTENELISPMDQGSEGVYVKQRKVEHNRAELDIDIKVSGVRDNVVNAEVAIFDELGDTVAVKSTKVRLSGRTISTATIPMIVKEPRLWNGTQDPFLYNVGVTISDNHRVTDRVVVKTGFRTVGYDSSGKLLLNGVPYEVRGVVVTQDRAMVGSALWDYQVKEDFKLITDMGANAVRVAGVKHHPHFYELCDKAGILVLSDLPIVGSAYLSDKAFIGTHSLIENGKQQTNEIIKQLYNHPSVVMWGLFSNLETRGDDPTEYISSLELLVKRTDPSRLTAAVSSTDGEINFISDMIIWDHFFGWKEGLPSDIEIWAKQLKREWKNLRSAVSYAAGASIYHQEDSLYRPDYLGNWHPERWQTHLHEEYYRYLSNDNHFWGIFVGNMFDYGAAGRTWGEGKGINDCGLVTFDRKYCKDAYYFYKANWNTEEPFVYIAERRWESRRGKQQQIKAYSNQSELELFVNGSLVGKESGVNGKFVWKNVELERGENLIMVMAVGEGDLSVSDRTNISICENKVEAL